MNKVILSRKGFDSSYGANASPIMPNGDLLSLPIPANNGEDGPLYSNLYYKRYSYEQIMENLGINFQNERCHLDPDLRKDAKFRKKSWLGTFGQKGTAEGQLRNQEVGEGDIFLFFGSFKRTKGNLKNLQFEPDHTRHIIFGFLKVGQVIQLDRGDEVPNWLTDHPHVTNQYLSTYKNQNTLYVAENENGFGTFSLKDHDAINDDIILTRNGFQLKNWQLPICFDQPNYRMTYHKPNENFVRVKDKVHMSSVSMGQDFVISNNQEVYLWAKSLIENYKK